MTTTPAASPSAAHLNQLSPSVRTAGLRALVRLGAAVGLVALATLAHFAGPWLPLGVVEPLGLGEDGTTYVQALTVPVLLLVAAAVALGLAVATAVRVPGLAAAPKVLARAAWNSARALAAVAAVLLVGAPFAYFGLVLGFWTWTGEVWVALLAIYGVPLLMVAVALLIVARIFGTVRSRSVSVRL